MEITLLEAVNAVPNGPEVFQGLKWAAHSLCIVLSITGLYAASVFLKDEDYYAGMTAIIGSCIIGIAPELAHFFTFKNIG